MVRSLTRRRKSKPRLESLACAVVAHTHNNTDHWFSFKERAPHSGTGKLLPNVEDNIGLKTICGTMEWKKRRSFVPLVEKQKLLPSFSLIVNVTVVTNFDYFFYKPQHFNKKKRSKMKYNFTLDPKFFILIQLSCD